MTQPMDDLSIEELQNRLLEIQEKIKEKEKRNLIDQLADELRSKETSFILELLEITQGKKATPAKVQRLEPSPKTTPKFVGKSEVYLRGGKVFYGIQEVKYTRLDRNGVLRISKDGKGLPPKVENLPAHIQKIVLGLPQKKEIPPVNKLGTSPASENAPQKTEKPEVTAETASSPDQTPVPTPAEPLPPEAEVLPVEPEALEESAVAPTSVTAIDEPTEDEPTFVQVDLLEASEPSEPIAEPLEPVRKRKTRSTPESIDPVPPVVEENPESSSPPKPKKPQPHALQGSFF